ncbi:ribonuclease H-like domain-containing protein [Tanacetum coccineum]
MEDDVDISALTMEQYIALIPDDIKPGIVNPKIGDDVEFEINANFMRELRRKLFAGTDDEDAYEHVRTVLEIVDLFHFPGVTHDAIMLRVFPITLKGRALRWKNRLPAGTITTWDLLKKEFIWRYCHPFITAKKLEEIRNFKQEVRLDKKSDDASGSGGSVIDGLPIVTKITDIKLDGSNFFAWSKTVSIYLRSIRKAFHIKDNPPTDETKDQWLQNDARLFLIIRNSIEPYVIPLLDHYLSLTAYVMEFKKMYEELNSLLPISADVKVMQKQREHIATLHSPHSSASNSALVSCGGFQVGSRNGHTTRNCKKLLAKKKGPSARTSTTFNKTVTISAKEYARIKGSVNVNSSTAATAIAGTESVKVYGDQDYCIW